MKHLWIPKDLSFDDLIQALQIVKLVESGLPLEEADLINSLCELDRVISFLNDCHSKVYNEILH